MQHVQCARDHGGTADDVDGDQDMVYAPCRVLESGSGERFPKEGI